jgi:hypothetical protein
MLYILKKFPLNRWITAAATAFICTYAISFLRHTHGHTWNTGYHATSTGTNSPPALSQRSGTNSAQSAPHSVSIRPIAYAE